jgi:CubicO group peptidase (beta-lactamase class C family)
MTLPRLARVLDGIAERERLSGVVTIHREGKLLLDRAYGFANRSDSLPNTRETRFQVASGSKIFTSVAVCRLVEEGRFSFETRLSECLDVEFPRFHPEVTVHHLLTHTSGIPDYFDETGGADYEALWRDRPMYRMTRPRDFLDLFRDGAMQFEPGSRFAYNDAAFVLLAAIVEQHGGAPFPRFVEREVFARAGMKDSGYFRFDRLPPRTAFAYVEDESEGSWRANIYSVPILGGGDGGAYVTAPDMAAFWSALDAHELLGEEMTEALLRPRVRTSPTDRAGQYGYGVWIQEDAGGDLQYSVEGWDPGVAFLSSWQPKMRQAVTVALNVNRSVRSVFDSIVPVLGSI